MKQYCVCLLVLAFVLVAQIHARQVTFINSCPFTISVEATPGGIICSNLGSGASCGWGIPASGYSGQFHRQNSNNDNTGFPSATLAEFTFANNVPSQWNWDWFDISIIPPGCPGSITSYDGCWCNSNEDGYDVGMTITPLASSCSNEVKTCLGRDCAGAYGYPTDNSKTSVCQDTTGDWEITFCPPGSFIDLGATELSQNAPCRGGSPPPPPPPPPPTQTSCSIQNGVDYYGNDISNKPVDSTSSCCDYCSSVPNCAVWTYAYGVCYAKTTTGSDVRSNAALVSGQVQNRATEGSTETFANESEPSSNTTSSRAIWIGLAAAAAFVVLLALIIGVALIIRKQISQEERV